MPSRTRFFGRLHDDLPCRARRGAVRPGRRSTGARENEHLGEDEVPDLLAVSFCDTHVPMIFMGRSARPGAYERRATVNDLAPTLAYVFGLRMPIEPGASLHTEIFARGPETSQPDAPR